MIEGSAHVGASLYFYGSENVGGVFTPILYCFDPATQAPCATAARVDLSTPANGSVVGWNPGVNGTGSGLVVQLTPDGTRVYLDQAFGGPTGSQVSCFDTATQNSLRRLDHSARPADAELPGTGYGSFLLNPGGPGPHGICAASLGGYRTSGRAAPREESCVAADKTPAAQLPGACRGTRSGHPRTGHLRAAARQLLLRVLRRQRRGPGQRVCVLLGLVRQPGVPASIPDPPLGHDQPAEPDPDQQWRHPRLRLHLRPCHQLHVGPG